MESFIDFEPREGILKATEELHVNHATIARASGLSPSAICLLCNKQRSLGVRFSTARQLYLGITKLYQEAGYQE